MGVRGLKSFIEKNESLFLKRYDLQQTELVIDGPNILHYLFQTNEDMGNIYGGDYNKFAVVIRKFFRSLKSCGVRPFVVMDGGHAVDDRKLATRKERAEKRVKRLFSIYRGMSTDVPAQARSGCFVYKNLPILGYILFIDILRDMDIPVHTCQFEADIEIARIANKRKCPVLSQDSDFYVVRIVRGFLPIDHLEMGDQENNDSFPSKIYHVENFISEFPNLGEDVFPLLAALFGNDYTNREDFLPFLESIPRPENTTRHYLKVCDEDQMKIIHWLLQTESFQTAKSQMVSAMEMETKDLDRVLEEVVMDYSLDQPPPPCPVSLPEWFLMDHERCLIANTFMTIITSQRIFLTCQPENFQRPSSYECSKSMRKILYSILLKDYGKTIVTEFDRKERISTSTLNTCILCRNIEVCDNIGHFRVPGLVEIEEKPVDDRKNLLKAALQIENQFDTFVPEDPELNFLLGVTSFWYKNSTPQVTECHLSSLVVCWIMLEIKYRIENSEGKSKENTISKAVFNINSVVLKKVWENLAPYCIASRTHKANFDTVHAFAQFQTCAVSAYGLNSILRFPFPSFRIENLFCGKFLHDFCIAMEKKLRKDKFILRILEADNNLSDLYKNIIETLKQTNLLYQR